MIAASHGVAVSFDDDGHGLGNARDAAVVANARAAQAVVRHDEEAARLAMVAVRDAHADSRLADRHLRRFLALGYVLDTERRTTWDGAELGPAHERARRVARLLVDLRDGRDVRGASIVPDLVRTVLPLPWSIELACRLHERGAADGRRLCESLLDAVGCPAHVELRARMASADERVAAGAAALLALIPRQPDHVVSVEVLGPLHVHRDDNDDVGGDLRRQRVRELLAMLVVDGVVTRDRAIDALWPEHDLVAGSRNLRVTLTYLRRLLEPDRPAGEASFHIRADASSIRLVPSAHLRVDLWEQRRLFAEASAARAAGEVEHAIELLAAATSLLRAAPLSDLDRIPGYEAEVERIRLLQTTSLLELGGLRLTVGDTAGALAAAERALAAEPYLEAAHRLAIAAAIQRGDRARVLAAITRTGRALAELGVAPEPTTEMLLRSASCRRGTTRARLLNASRHDSGAVRASTRRPRRPAARAGTPDRRTRPAPRPARGRSAARRSGPRPADRPPRRRRPCATTRSIPVPALRRSSSTPIACGDCVERPTSRPAASDDSTTVVAPTGSAGGRSPPRAPPAPSASNVSTAPRPIVP